MFIYTWANPTVIQLKYKISIMKQCLTIKWWWGTYKLKQSRNNAHDLQAVSWTFFLINKVDSTNKIYCLNKIFEV